MPPDINPHVAEAFSRMPFKKPMTAKEIVSLCPNDGAIGTTSINNALKCLAKDGYVKRGVARRYGIITWTKMRDLNGADRPAPRPGVRVVRVPVSLSGAENPVMASVSLPAEPWYNEEGASA